MRSDLDRFEEKIERIPIAGCWLWTGATYRKGYGHFRRKVKNKWVMYKAHRFSYSHFNGEIPEGLSVLHKCDVPCCVNPHHLFVGTLEDNNKDTRQKGRAKFGRNPKHVHLSFAHANNFRLIWEATKHEWTQKEFANEIGISPQQLSRILRNEIWVKPERG